MTLELYEQRLSAPATAPTFSPPAAGIYLFAHRRARPDGGHSLFSPVSATNALPAFVVVEVWQGSIGQIAEDEILVSDDSGTTWRQVPRPAGDKLGDFAVPAFDPSWPVVTDIDTQTQNFTLDSAPAVGTPAVLPLQIRNGDEQLTFNDLIFSIVDAATELTQNGLSGLVTFNFLGTYADVSDGSLSGTPVSVLWESTGLNYNRVPLTLAPNTIASFDVTIEGVAGQPTALASQLLVSTNTALIPTTIAPAFPERTLLIRNEFGTSLPLVSATGGVATIHRALVNIGGGRVAVNPSDLSAPVANDVYKIFVTQQGVFGFQRISEGSIPATAIELAEASFSGGTIFAGGLTYKVGVASANFTDYPTTVTGLLIGEAVKLADNAGSLNTVRATAASDTVIGIVSRLPENGFVGVTYYGPAIALAGGNIAPAAALVSNASGKLVTSGDSKQAAQALESAANNDNVYVHVARWVP